MANKSIYKHLNLETIKENKEIVVNILYSIVCLFIIARSVYLSIHISFVDSSLWMDEAMLAYSLTTRSIAELTSSVFRWEQSAPVLYLYLVKIITLIFGNTEFTLRVWSLIAYLLTLVASYYILTKVIITKFPLLAVAYISNLTFMLIFSYEFKPYMNDCLVILLVIILYHHYLQKKIGTVALTALFAIFIWLCNPSAFFIGAILLYEFVMGCRHKDYKKIKNSVVSGIVILSSFAIYYFYWLKPVIDSGYMAVFWENRRLPFPLSASDLDTIKVIRQDVLGPLGNLKYLIFDVAFAGLFVNIFWKKNKLMTILYIGLLITLVASMMGSFPIETRLCLFMYPVFSILFFTTISEFYGKHIVLNFAILGLSFWVLFTTKGFKYFSDEKNIHKEFANGAIDYLEGTIKEGETTFIYGETLPVYLYHKKYTLDDLDKVKYPPIISNEHFYTFSQNDLDRLLKHSSSYIFISRKELLLNRKSPLIDSLRVKGNVDVVFDGGTSLVYYFTNK